MVHDFDQFTTTTLADVPKIVEREFMKTKSLQEVASEINFIRITSKIKSFKVQKGGFLKADFVVYEIVSEQVESGQTLTAYRTDADFYDLRKLMVVALPYVRVPPLPSKNLLLKISEKAITKRQRFY